MNLESQKGIGIALIILLAVVVFMFVVVICVVEGQGVEPPIKWQQITGGKYIIAGDQMQIEVEKPLLNDRFAIYGRVITDPETKARSLDISADTKLTKQGREIYTRIMRLRTKTGIFAAFSCPMAHANMTILKYPSVSWGFLEPEIKKIFKAVFRK